MIFVTLQEQDVSWAGVESEATVDGGAVEHARLNSLILTDHLALTQQKLKEPGTWCSEEV